MQLDSNFEPTHEMFESVARYFSVLGEPTRLKILSVICGGEQCVSDIIQATGLAQANISRHLGLMYQAGLLSRRREGTLVFYRVSDRHAAELCRSIRNQVQLRLSEPGDVSLAPPVAFEPPSQKETARV
jgi:DNA-binding transcriptional ArsR family regulator